MPVMALVSLLLLISYTSFTSSAAPATAASGTPVAAEPSAYASGVGSTGLRGTNRALLVDTTSGRALGTHIDPFVVAWRGIPYAEPPVGALRFEPPRALARRAATDAIDARRYGPACFQFGFNSLAPTQVRRDEQSEDCLTVNVFKNVDAMRQNSTTAAALSGGANETVRTAAADENGKGVAESGLLPVIVWFHGGSYGEGSAAGVYTPT
jgi:para-nitrobenzyl esterase